MKKFIILFLLCLPLFGCQKKTVADAILGRQAVTASSSRFEVIENVSDGWSTREILLDTKTGQEFLVLWGSHCVAVTPIDNTP